MKNYEQIRQEVHKKYKKEINDLKSEIRSLKDLLAEAYKANDELIEKNNKLKLDLSQRNERLDSFLTVMDKLKY